MLSTTIQLPNHLRPRREKVFGPGPRLPLDREAKLRIRTAARCLLTKTEAGRHYGVVTAKVMAVLDALLWSFHNAKRGQCDPSYEAIAKKADCARSTVAVAIKVLEAVGILSWVNRITRERAHEHDLFGHWVSRWRVVRTSNAYAFRDPKAPAHRPGASKSEFRTGTMNQASINTLVAPNPAPLDPDNPVERALMNLGKCLKAAPEGAA